LDRCKSPLFRRAEAGVDEGFGQIELAAIAQILGEALQHAFEHAGPLPRLKTPMTRLIRWIPTRQVVPRRPGAQDPQHTVQDGARLRPRSAAPVGATRRTKQRLEDGPLGVSQVHAVEYDGDRNVVHHPVWGL
jgi:hypothetical protein